MKKLIRKFMVASPVAAIALMTFAANAFAAASCHGPYYEPEMPESLKK